MSTTVTERPFGPYNIVDFVKPANRSKILSLSSVLFRQRNQLVGLDIVDNTRLRDRGPVLFRGTLRLTDANKACLTQEGKQRLRDDLSHRHGRQYFDSPGFKAKVDVCGELFSEPIGLESSGAFKIVAHDTTAKLSHEFVVISLHVQSYALSRRYLSKWSVLRAITSIVMRNEVTPIASRTPRWLVTKYLEENIEHFHDKNRNPSLTPRHVHRSDVYNLFAHHRRWLSKKMPKPILLNRKAWECFVEVVERRLDDSLAPQERNPDDCNDLDEHWPEEDKKLLAEDQSVRNSPAQPEHDTTERDNLTTYRHIGGSQASRELSPEPTIAEAEKAIMVTGSDIFSAVPELLLLQEPAFPTGSEWYCPIKSCEYSIILRRAYRMNFEWMNEDDKEFLRSGCWGPDSDRAVELFCDVVEHHYYEHLKMAGIRHVACQYTGQDAINNPRFQFIELTGPRQMKPDYTSSKFEWIHPHHR